MNKKEKQDLVKQIGYYRTLGERDLRIIWSYFASYYLEYSCDFVKTHGAVQGAHIIFDAIEGYLAGGELEEKQKTRLDGFIEVLREIDFVKIKKKMTSEAIEFIIPSDSFWPYRLTDLGHYEPVGLYVRGNTNLKSISQKSIAFVGSRNCSTYGKSVTKKLVSELAKQGWGVVSGGAYGIDIMAHNAATNHNAMNIEKSVGNIAFMASGVDNLTPNGNIGYFEDMLINGGTFVSEYPLGSHPTSFRYLERNRLIAALSRATIIVEASFRSGALNTVSYANKISRAVGAVPGPIGALTSASPHNLIRNNQAILVRGVKDIVELSSDKFDLSYEETKHEELPRGEKDIIRLFDKHKTVTLPLIKETLQLSESECKGVCVQLELKGMLKRGKKANSWVKVG